MSGEQRDYAILISLSMREEAEVMASALRAEGTDAFVGNRHHANVDWGWTIALGGMQVFVPRAKLQEAKEAIRTRLKDAAETPDPEAEPTRRRDRWKVWAVIAVSLFLPIGGLTAHTLDGHMNQIASQSDMEEWARELAAEWARHGCEMDDMLVTAPDGTVSCAKAEPYVPEDRLGPLIRGN